MHHGFEITTGGCSRMKDERAHSLELMRRQGMARCALPAFGAEVGV
jgi:hypothetical protein